MRVFLAILVLALVTSCASDNRFQDTFNDKEDVAFKGDVSRYFLPDMPNWMNFSKNGRCQRKQTIKYIDFPSFRNSFSLSYTEAVNFQGLYNREYQKKRDIYRKAYITPQSEKKLFFNILDKIKANIVAFRLPKYKRVNLLWVDPIIAYNDYSVLERIMKRRDMDKGHPVFISMCLTSSKFEAWAKKLQVSSNVRLISSEMFSIYDESNKSTYEFSIDLKKLLTKEHKVYFYLLGKSVPENIKGDFRVIKLEGDIYEKFY